MKFQDLMLKFPHFSEKIFPRLDNESLFKCREVTRLWQDIIDGRNYPWLRISRIPTILTQRNLYLHLAAETGQVQAFKTAFNQEVDRNIKNELGETSFHHACKNGRFSIAQLLMNEVNGEFSHGIDINDKTKDHMTGFHWACMRGHADVVK